MQQQKEQVREAMKAAPVVTQLEDVRLEKMRQDARVVKLGTIIDDFGGDDQFDVPTFVRRQQVM